MRKDKAGNTDKPLSDPVVITHLTARVEALEAVREDDSAALRDRVVALETQAQKFAAHMAKVAPILDRYFAQETAAAPTTPGPSGE